LIKFNIQHLFKVTIVVLSLTSLAGCLGLTRDIPKESIVSVSSIKDSGKPSAKKETVLMLDRFESSSFLNNDKIVLTKQGTVYDYFADIRWSDKIPAMLYSSLKASYENKSSYNVIDFNDSTIDNQYLLKMDLRHFEANYDEGDLSMAPEIYIEIYAVLVRRSDQKIVASKVFSKTDQVSENKLMTIVTSFDDLYQQTQNDLITWTDKSINNQ
jgi:cholesterol transport system auxiliary component